MTGGQDPVGQLSVPDIAGILIGHGVRRVIVTTDDVDAVPRASPCRRQRRHGAGLESHPDRRSTGDPGEGRWRDGAHPRPGMCGAEPPIAQTGDRPDADATGRDQPPHLRGLRRLRRGEQLPLGPVDRHTARRQDDDRSDHLQSRLLLPRRRLSELHDRRVARRRRRGAAASGATGRLPRPGAAVRPRRTSMSGSPESAAPAW